MITPFANIAFTPNWSQHDELPDEIPDLVFDEDGCVDLTLAFQELAPGEKKLPKMLFTQPVPDFDTEFELDPDEATLFQVGGWFTGNPEGILAWARRMSVHFPEAVVAVRCEEQIMGLTIHAVFLGGKVVKSATESEYDVANMNLRCAIGIDWLFEGCWMEAMLATDPAQLGLDGTTETHINRVLKSKDASADLLNAMRFALTLTPKQEALLLAHPNFGPDKFDEDYWREA